MVNTCGQNMWSRQQFCWTVTNRLCNRLLGVCLPACFSVAIRPRVYVWGWYILLSLCTYACSCAGTFARRLGCRTQETGETCRQVFGAASPLCNFGPLMCLSSYQRASAVLSMQRHWSVQLQSADPRPHSFPCRSRARQPGQTWHKTEDERHTTRAWSPGSCFLFKN